jgi:hypothetical protein
MHWGQFAVAWPRQMPVLSRYSRVSIIQRPGTHMPA